MNQRQHSRGSLFLMEIMLDTLFFSILTTMCLQIFFKAHTISANSTELHRSVTVCTSIAEVYQSGLDGKESLLNTYPDAVFMTQAILIYYDENFIACPEKDASYRAIVGFPTDFSTAVISFCEISDTAEPIYTLEVSAFHSTSPALQMGGL